MLEKTELMWGLDRDLYNKLAEDHSKANIWLWLIGGFVYSYLNGSLISISAGLLIIPGIFIASFASIPTLWVNIKKMQIVPNTNNVLVLFGFTLWYLIDLVYPIVLSVLFIKIVNTFL